MFIKKTTLLLTKFIHMQYGSSCDLVERTIKRLNVEQRCKIAEKQRHKGTQLFLGTFRVSLCTRRSTHDQLKAPYEKLKMQAAPCYQRNRVEAFTQDTMGLNIK